MPNYSIRTALRMSSVMLPFVTSCATTRRRPQDIRRKGRRCGVRLPRIFLACPTKIEHSCFPSFLRLFRVWAGGRILSPLPVPLYRRHTMFIQLFAVLAVALTGVLASPTGPIRARQSSSCTYTCPTTDTNGYPYVYTTYPGGGQGCLYNNGVGHICLYSYTVRLNSLGSCGGEGCGNCD